MNNVFVRPEADDDIRAIDHVVRTAFGSETEVHLVRAIRASSNYVPEFTLVAEVDGRIVGHVMLSRVELEDGTERHGVLTLSPLAVSPEAQGRGIGSKLVTDAIRRADEAGEPLIFLEGNPRYYSRFGFEPATEMGIAIPLPDWAPPEAAQVIALSRYLPAIRGNALYPAYFRELEAAHERESERE